MSKTMEMLTRAFESAPTTAEKMSVIDAIRAYEADDFKRTLLDSYRAIICKAINEAAGAEIAKDDASMLANLELIADKYEEASGYTKRVLSPVYAKMLLSLRENGNEHREVVHLNWSDKTVEATVRLIGNNGRVLGTGLCRMALKQDSFDSIDGQKELTQKLAIGKATADAYRDSGIGLFRNKQEEAEQESDVTHLKAPAGAPAPAPASSPAASPSPAAAADPMMGKPAEALKGKAEPKRKPKPEPKPAEPEKPSGPAKAPSAMMGVIADRKKEEPDLPLFRMAAEQEEKKEQAQPAEAGPISYPSLEEAWGTTFAMKGKTFREVADEPNGTRKLLSRYKLLFEKKGGRAPAEEQEIRALHVIIASNNDMKEMTKGFGAYSLFA